jgi:crotonobetainyl-CoA:carnitine CoA-transferase CaiB-like acyl-CoA transferase
MVNVTQAALATGAPARRHGNAHPHIVPYQTFAASDGLVVIAIGNDAQWRRLCDALEATDLASDDRFALNPGRVLHRADVVAAIATRLSQRTRAEWLERFAAANVPAGPVREVHEVVADPALRARDFVRSTSLSGADDSVEVFATPWRTDGVRPPLRLEER